MLIQITPKQITDHWNEISMAIAISLPPTVFDNIEVMDNILASLLKGKVHCWLCIEDNKIVGVVTTMFMQDPITLSNNLVVYTIYSPPNKVLKKESWFDSIDTLKKFAKHNNCFQIIAYSNVPYVIKIATNGLKGKAEYTVLTWEV